MQESNIQEILIRTLLRKYGFGKLNFANLDRLAQSIKSNGLGSVSSNTLARIAGLRTDKRNTFDYNLDILSGIIGLGTYKNFERCIKLNRGIGIADLEEEPLDFIIKYTIEAAQSNDLKYIAFIEKYIESNGVGICNYYSIGNALMIGCRNNKSPQKLIDYSTESPIITQLFYESYVDMDYLIGYFGEAMISLARLNTGNKSTQLFSNSIAYLCERNRNRISAFKKRGDSLLQFDIDSINHLIHEIHIYPVARWLRACIDFCLISSNTKKGNELIEFAFSLITELSPDDAIIVISEISEIDNKIFPKDYSTKLKELFLLKCNHINYEYDCYLNAALNISIKLGCKDLICHSKAMNYFNNNPLKFLSRSNSIINKINLLSH